jgi:ribosomal protein S18 acetylase RimI-like enzyme
MGSFWRPFTIPSTILSAEENNGIAMKIISLGEANLDEAIRFVSRLNPDSRHNISYFGENEKEIAADFAAIRPPEGFCYLAFSEDGALVGLLGVELDLELGRCWLLGPLVDYSTWDPVADALYSEILYELPEEIDDQELFFDAGNTNLDQFAVKHGFNSSTGAITLSLDRTSYQRVLHDDDPGFDARFNNQFIALHSRLFPNTYYSAEQLIKKAADKDKRLLIHITNGNLSGYIFIQARDSSQDGIIDFIGVGEELRRKGIGKHLLTSGLNWLFSFPQMVKATLTVNTPNLPALRLYKSMGFKTARISKGYRKCGNFK